MAVLATSLKRACVVIVGAFGQTILTTVGMLSDWTNSMVIVSPDALVP